jgi:hypothetical protein
LSKLGFEISNAQLFRFAAARVELQEVRLNAVAENNATGWHQRFQLQGLLLFEDAGNNACSGMTANEGLANKLEDIGAEATGLEPLTLCVTGRGSGFPSQMIHTAVPESDVFSRFYDFLSSSRCSTAVPQLFPNKVISARIRAL